MNTLPEKTYFEQYAESLLKQAGLNKASFAKEMGVARQHIQKVFDTKNILTLIKASEVLGVPLMTLIYGKEEEIINGFIDVNGTVYKIKSRKDIEDLLTKI